MSWPSALALLKLFVKCQTPVSSPGLHSHHTAQEIAQLSKHIYLCVIVREVLWLGWSLILWQAGKSLFKFKKLPPPLQALLSLTASMLTNSFTGAAPALLYYPCIVCQYVSSLSCKGDEISLSDDYSKHEILLGFLKKYFFKCQLTVEALCESLTAEKSRVAEGFPLLYSRNRRFFPLPNPGNFLSSLSNFFYPHN